VDQQQYRLMQLLAPPGSNLCVIGDPNQAIYGFRGADAACFSRFAADYRNAAVVNLRRNYRSSGTIVTASAQVIASSEDALSLVRDMRERIAIHAAATERAEAEFVVATIERLIGGSSFFAIDSAASPARPRRRSASPISRCCTARTRRPRCWRKRSRAPAFRSRPLRSGAWRKIGRSLRCWRRLRPTKSRSPLRSRSRRRAFVIARTPIRPQSRQRWPGSRRSRSCGGNRKRFADALALATDADFLDPRADRVSLLTLHAAKGLEFSVVFVVGLEDGILPLTWGAPDDAALAEERRLFYVGMTRAKDRLILSRAKQRLWRGKMRTLTPSPFLGDIEAELLRHQQAEPARRRPENRQLTLF
jgi:ATP-dependent DNA helicase UvrD/PcrA